MTSSKKVLVDPDNLNGNPYLEGTRLTVFDMVSDCIHEGIKTYLHNSDQVSVDDLKMVFGYCKSRGCDDAGSYCGGCSLRDIQDGIRNEKDFINRFARIYFEDSEETLHGMGEGAMLMPGSPENISENWRGCDGWVLAAKLQEELDSLLDEEE